LDAAGKPMAGVSIGDVTPSVACHHFGRAIIRSVDLRVAIPIGMAVAGGLAFLAYRQRAFFTQLSISLVGLMLAALFCIVLWNIAVTRTAAALAPFINQFDREQAQAARESFLVPDVMMVVCLGTMAYVVFLTRTPTDKSDGR
jgi:hypothetical protein